MSELRTLHDAFAELERRADATAADAAPAVRQRRTVRLVPVAATAVAVASLVAGAVWLVPGDPGTHVAGPPASSAPSTATARSPLPASPDDLVARFAVVLGDTATFEATQRFAVPASSSSKNPQPPGTGSIVTPDPANPDGPTHPLIGGTLTSAGVTGSFSLGTYSGESGPDEWCRHPYRQDCEVGTLPDGSRLATGTARPAPGAVSYLACLKRADGTVVVLHVGNQEDPQGAAPDSPGGRILAPQPPLTLDQLKAIVSSDKW